MLVVWKSEYTDMEPLAIYTNLVSLKRDYPTARNVDFIEDDEAEYLYMYVEVVK